MKRYFKSPVMRFIRYEQELWGDPKVNYYARERPHTRTRLPAEIRLWL